MVEKELGPNHRIIFYDESETTLDKDSRIIPLNIPSNYLELYRSILPENFDLTDPDLWEILYKSKSNTTYRSTDKKSFYPKSLMSLISRAMIPDNCSLILILKKLEHGINSSW